MFDFQLGRKRRGVVGRTTGLESVSELRRVSFAKGIKLLQKGQKRSDMDEKMGIHIEAIKL